MFFKNLTFGKITEEDYKDIKVKKDKSQQYNTTSFSSEGIKSDYNYSIDDDIMHLKLNIPGNISSQYNDIQTRFNRLIPESRRMISEIEEQLKDRKRVDLPHGGIADNTTDNIIPNDSNNYTVKKPLTDLQQLNYTPGDNNTINSDFDNTFKSSVEDNTNSKSNNTIDSNTDSNTDSNSDNNIDYNTDSNSDNNIDYNTDSNTDSKSNNIIDSNTDSNIESNSDNNIDQDTDNITIKPSDDVNIVEPINYNNTVKPNVDNVKEDTEYIDNENEIDDIEYQITKLYEPLKNKLIDNDKLNINEDLQKKLILLSNDLDPFDNLLKYEKENNQVSQSNITQSDSKEISNQDSDIDQIEEKSIDSKQHEIEKIDLTNNTDNEISISNDQPFEEYPNIEQYNSEDTLDNDQSNNELLDNDKPDIKQQDQSNTDSSLSQSSIDHKYIEKIISSVIEDKENEKKKLTFDN